MRTPGDLKDEMNVVAASVQKLVRAGRTAGLSNEEAVLACLIGLVSIIRVDRLDEDRLLRAAKTAVPTNDRYSILISHPVE